MKNTLKKALAIALTLIALFTLAVTAFAADVSAEQAKIIALADAGYSLAEVEYITAEYDFDDGRKKWNIDFVVKAEDGRYLDYDYEIAASDGRIVEKDRDYENDYYGGYNSLEDRFEIFFRKIINWILSLFS